MPPPPPPRTTLANLAAGFDEASRRELMNVFSQRVGEFECHAAYCAGACSSLLPRNLFARGKDLLSNSFVCCSNELWQFETERIGVLILRFFVKKVI